MHFIATYTQHQLTLSINKKRGKQKAYDEVVF